MFTKCYICYWGKTNRMDGLCDDCSQAIDITQCLCDCEMCGILIEEGPLCAECVVTLVEATNALKEGKTIPWGEVKKKHA